MNFRGTRCLPSKIASDFRRQTRVLFPIFPPIPRESEKIRPFSDIFPDSKGIGENSSFFPDSFGVGEKGPGKRANFSLFMCFSLVLSGHRALIGARREPLFPPISILFPISGKEKSSIFLFALCRRNSLAIFDGRTRVLFPEKEKSSIFLFTVCRRNRLRFSTADEGPFSPTPILFTIPGPFSWSFFSDSEGVGKKERISPDSFGVGGNIRKRTRNRKFALFSAFFSCLSFRFRVPSDSRVFFLFPCGAEGIKT